jgi:hemerythrin-like domain-containing protein
VEDNRTMAERRGPDDILGALKRDHVNSSRLLSLVGAQIEHIDHGDTPDWNLLAQIMRYTFEYGHLFHHRIEDVLYERLRARAGAARPTLDEITGQHAALEQQVAACRLLIASADASTGGGTLAKMLGAHSDDLNQHMHSEEQHLFPLIEVLFKPADWRALEADLKRPRDPLFDAPVRDSYRNLATRIGK